jgi:DNA-directed RNA polymerase subunit M/transcription elongation factor TFIIS
LGDGFGQQIFFFFCGGSNNILYPKEDRDQKALLFACRNCDHQVSISLSLLSPSKDFFFTF